MTISWSIDYITLNSKPSCSLYAYISRLRYEALKFRSTFDYCRDMAGPIKICFRRPWYCTHLCVYIQTKRSELLIMAQNDRLDSKGTTQHILPSCPFMIIYNILYSAKFGKGKFWRIYHQKLLVSKTLANSCLFAFYTYTHHSSEIIWC